mmetsp:Transcript_442/g.1362  ORF Transcript_442/g.1362 Transcript_442/m.1362 type:complete len:593 (+) Transcript_442:151-1929(+)
MAVGTEAHRDLLLRQQAEVREIEAQIVRARTASSSTAAPGLASMTADPRQGVACCGQGLGLPTRLCCSVAGIIPHAPENAPYQTYGVQQLQPHPQPRAQLCILQPHGYTAAAAYPSHPGFPGFAAAVGHEGLSKKAHWPAATAMFHASCPPPGPSSASRESASNVLIQRWRKFGERMFQLWVEDYVLHRGVRVHALDVVASSEVHSDLLDADIQAMFDHYSQSSRSRGAPARCDHGQELLAFLSCLLDATRLELGEEEGKLELQFPAAIEPSWPGAQRAQAAPAQVQGDCPVILDARALERSTAPGRAAPRPSSGASRPGQRAACRVHAAGAAPRRDGERRCPPLQSHSARSGARPARPHSARPAAPQLGDANQALEQGLWQVAELQRYRQQAASVCKAATPSCRADYADCRPTLGLHASSRQRQMLQRTHVPAGGADQWVMRAGRRHEVGRREPREVAELQGRVWHGRQRPHSAKASKQKPTVVDQNQASTHEDPESSVRSTLHAVGSERARWQRQPRPCSARAQKHKRVDEDQGGPSVYEDLESSDTGGSEVDSRVAAWKQEWRQSSCTVDLSAAAVPAPSGNIHAGHAP